MSVENTWDNINSGQDEELGALLNSSNLKKLPSQNPLGKIKKTLFYNIVWGVLISIIILILLIYLHIWQVQLTLIVVFIFSLWAVFTAWQQYKKMDTDVSANSPLLTEMKRHHNSIHEWMHTQQRVALFIYPISATGGFMLGGAEGSGKPVAELMNKPLALITLLIALVILVPACYYVTRWMFKVSFGKHLKALNENIQTLEAEK